MWVVGYYSEVGMWMVGDLTGGVSRYAVGILLLLSLGGTIVYFQRLTFPSIGSI